jgi:Protein of unknown function (DUF2034)
MHRLRSSWRTRRFSSPLTHTTSCTSCSYRSSASPKIPSPTLPLHALIPPGSTNHSTLSSFLAHARRTSLGPNSPVFVGTCFEYHVLASLRPFGFSLQRVGRTADNGIDLLGTWTVPSHPVPIRVLLQCKNHARALNPEHVRELEGAFAGAPAGWRRAGVMGFLVSPKPASRGVREAVGRSNMPIGYVMVDGIDHASAQMGEEEGGGKLRQFLWNKEAQQKGLEGLGVTMKYSPGITGAEVEEEVALTWNGWAIKRLAEPQLSTTLDATIDGGRIITDVSTIQTTLSSVVEDAVTPTPNKRGRPRKDGSVTTTPTKPKGQKKKNG